MNEVLLDPTDVINQMHASSTSPNYKLIIAIAFVILIALLIYWFHFRESDVKKN